MTASGGAADGLLTREAAAGGTVSYTFTAASPGTYLYESGSDVAKQVEMGLYGALIVRPSAAPTLAYGDVATQFDPSREYLLLLAEIDPVPASRGRDRRHLRLQLARQPLLHHQRPQLPGHDPGQRFGDCCRTSRTARWCGSSRTNSTANTQPALIRMVNAGVDNHPFHPHGNHTTQIAQDGRQLLSPGGAPAFDRALRRDHRRRRRPRTSCCAGTTQDHWDPDDQPAPGRRRRTTGT